MSHKKFGPDRFSRFNVYWIQTYKHKPNLYIEDNWAFKDSKGETISSETTYPFNLYQQKKYAIAN